MSATEPYSNHKVVRAIVIVLFVAEGHGSFVAPSTGIHGWSWENKNSKDITIHLTAAGFFDGIKQMNASGIEEFPAEDAQ